MKHYSDCGCGGWDAMCESCQEQLEQQRDRISVLEAFVKAFDEWNSVYDKEDYIRFIRKAREAVGVVK
jgi:hypothetical protein